jgi:hypothetical protein
MGAGKGGGTYKIPPTFPAKKKNVGATQRVTLLKGLGEGA